MPDESPPTPTPREAQAQRVQDRDRVGRLIVAALVIALLIKTFLFQAFYIPSDSMVPTLKTNDRVIVNKLSYHLHTVHRGDIVVFTTPKGPDGKPIDPTIKDLVKRVIGLPGETISEKNDHVLINGKAARTSRTCPTGTVTDCTSFQRSASRPARCRPTDYWVMGDNRAQFARLALLRADHEERDRRPRVRAHLAAQPPRPLASDARRRQSAIHSLTVATIRSGRSQ